MDKHGCKSVHIGTATFADLPEGSGRKTVVEIFEVLEHPMTDVCYAWRPENPASASEPAEITTALRLPPITDAKKAVMAELQSSPGISRG